MSGSPKYVSPSLTAAIRSTIATARRNEAIQEGRMRRGRAAEWMQQREMQRRSAVMDQATALEHELAALRDRMSAGDEMAIVDQINRARATASGSASPDMANVEAMLIVARQRLRQAVNRAHEESARRAASRREAFEARIAALQERIALLSRESDTRVEQSALEEARQMLYQARSSLRGSDETMTDYQIRLADKAVDKLELRVQQDEERAQRQRSVAEDHLLAWESTVAGLQADTTVMRWLAAEVEAMQQRSTELRERFAADDYKGFNLLPDEALEQEKQLVDKASAAQIKADQRDYIASGIRSTLAEMGFIVSENVEEHPGHPATALSFTAVNDTGRGISVSVPVEGEVYYDLDGYEKSTVSRVGGGTAAVCDSAQQVIEEMHDLLEEGFEVQMGELMWEGKDPDRILRMADELPGNRPQDREDRK